jgi:hypothetical protein
MPKQSPKRREPEKQTLDFETFVRAALQTGGPPKAKRVKKRKARK